MQHLKCKYAEFNIDLELRSRCTIICGNTATGKTYLFDTLRNIENLENTYFINYNSVKNIENYNAAVDYIKRSSNKIIIIDQADDIQEINDEIMYEINMDNDNTYIIIGRAPELNYSYSDVAELIIEDNEFRLEYLLPEPII